MPPLHVSLRMKPRPFYRVRMGSGKGIDEVPAVVDIVVSVAMVLQRKVPFPFVGDDCGTRSYKLQDK